jgi:hypothetical protein
MSFSTVPSATSGLQGGAKMEYTLGRECCTVLWQGLGGLRPMSESATMPVYRQGYCGAQPKLPFQEARFGSGEN